MGQKLCSKLLFIYSPNTDGFYTFYVSQGSVATQLRCGGMFSNHFTTNFYRMQQWKNFENRSIFGKDMGKILWLTFWGHPVVAYIIYYPFHVLVLLINSDSAYSISRKQQKLPDFNIPLIYALNNYQT